MNARAADRWYRVRDILHLFQQMGCELHELPSPITSDDETFRVRYLLNEESGRFITVTDLDDDDRVPRPEVEAWMRRLEKIIPLPPDI